MLSLSCTAELGGYAPVPSADGSLAEFTIQSPAASALFTREHLDEVGARVALVPFELTADSSIVQIALQRDEQQVAVLEGPDFAQELALTRLGDVSIVASGYDRAGQLVASASVSFQVVEPELPDCHAWLDLYGLIYEPGPQRDGVAQPVTVMPPINGIAHRYWDSDTPRETFFMDCELALALAKAAPSLRRRDVVEVVDIGVYNYRCIGGEGTPPDCPRGISQHAFAWAIDFAAYVTSDGTIYSVNDDWIVDPDEQPTCAAVTEGAKDDWLHDLICEQKDAGIWNIVLTPNYNSAHRNHFHVDLKTGSDFLEAGFRVDQGPDLH